MWKYYPMGGLDNAAPEFAPDFHDHAFIVKLNASSGSWGVHQLACRSEAARHIAELHGQGHDVLVEPCYSNCNLYALANARALYATRIFQHGGQFRKKSPASCAPSACPISSCTVTTRPPFVIPTLLTVIPANAGIQSIKQSLATPYKASLRDFSSLDSRIRGNDEKGASSYPVQTARLDSQ